MNEAGKITFYNGFIDSAPALILVLMAAIALGIIYFAGLRFTVRSMARSSNPHLVMIFSFLLRSALLLAGFWLITSGDWLRLLLAMSGFWIVRAVATRYWGALPPKEPA